MKTRGEFARAIASLALSHLDRAVAFLWYYRHTQQYEERSASELAGDLQDEAFPKPNVTRLSTELRRSRDTVRGKRPETYQIDVRRLGALDEKYLPLLGTANPVVTPSVLDPSSVVGTRLYLEKLVHQINGSYDYGFYDGCAVLCRRLMESLIIEVYVGQARHREIQQNGVFLTLDRLLAYVRSDSKIPLGRSTPKIFEEVKQLGDTAAHDRTYITQQVDVDDLKPRYRKLIAELLALAGIHK